MQKRTDFFDNSFFNAVPDKPLATRNKPHNNQLCADLSRFISAYSVVSHFLRFAWQTTALYAEFKRKRSKKAYGNGHVACQPVNERTARDFSGHIEQRVDNHCDNRQ